MSLIYCYSVANRLPSASIVVCSRKLSFSEPVCKNVAGKYGRSRDRTRMLTYEMAMRPTTYGVKKAWLSWHSQNVEEFRQVQPYVILQDEAIRRFLRGFFPKNIINEADEVIIKRRGNMIILTGFLKLTGPNKNSIYWMLGFVEEFFTILLKQPVKLEFQFVKNEEELAYKYI